MNTAANAGVFSFRIFPDNDPIKLGSGYMAQRAGDARKDAGRTNVRVLIQRLADREAQSPKRNMVGDVGRPNSAEIDRVELAQLFDAIGRHHHAVLLVV